MYRLVLAAPTGPCRRRVCDGLIDTWSENGVEVAAGETNTHGCSGSHHADIEENGVKLKLTVVDTPGFGDFVNNDDS